MREEAGRGDRLCRPPAGLPNLVSMQWHRRLIGSVYHGLWLSIDSGHRRHAACGELFTARRPTICSLASGSTALLSTSKCCRWRCGAATRICELPVHWEAVPGSKANLRVRDSLNMSWSVLGLYVRHSCYFATSAIVVRLMPLPPECSGLPGQTIGPQSGLKLPA